MDQNELSDFLRLKAWCKTLQFELDKAETKIEIQQKQIDVLLEEKQLAKGELRELKKDALVMKYVEEIDSLKAKVKEQRKDIERLIMKTNDTSTRKG